MTAAIISHVTKLMEIYKSEIKTHMKGINKQGQNLAGHFTLQKHLEVITQVSF